MVNTTEFIKKLQENFDKKHNNSTKKEIDYEQYRESAKELAKKLFGEDVYNKISTEKIQGFDWDGLDIDTGLLLVNCPKIKTIVSKEYNEYYDCENDKPSVLDILIQAIFYYGYQQLADTKYKEMERDRDYCRLNNMQSIESNETLYKQIDTMKKEIEDLKEQLKNKS